MIGLVSGDVGAVADVGTAAPTATGTGEAAVAFGVAVGAGELGGLGPGAAELGGRGPVLGVVIELKLGVAGVCDCML